MPDMKAPVEPGCPAIADDPATCPDGFDYYICATDGFVGCCSSNPCSLGSASCPAANQPVPSISWATSVSLLAQTATDASVSNSHSSSSASSRSFGHPQSSMTLPVMVSIVTPSSDTTSAAAAAAPSQISLSTIDATETITIVVPIAPTSSLSTLSSSATTNASATMMLVPTTDLMSSSSTAAAAAAAATVVSPAHHHPPVSLIVGLTTGAVALLIGFGAAACMLWRNRGGVRALEDSEAVRLREERENSRPYYRPDNDNDNDDEGQEILSPVTRPRPASLHSQSTIRVSASGDPVGPSEVDMGENGEHVDSDRDVRWPLASPCSDDESMMMVREPSSSMGALIDTAMRVESTLDNIATLSSPTTPIRQSVSIIHPADDTDDNNNASTTSSPTRRPRAVSMAAAPLQPSAWSDDTSSSTATTLRHPDHPHRPETPEPQQLQCLRPLTYIPGSTRALEQQQQHESSPSSKGPEKPRLNLRRAARQRSYWVKVEPDGKTSRRAMTDDEVQGTTNVTFVRLTAAEFMERLNNRPAEEAQLHDAVSATFMMGKDGLWTRKESCGH